MIGNQKENWHAVELGEVLKKLGVNPAAGLTTLEARERIKNLGQNILPRGKKTTAIEMLIRQFTSPLVYILLVASILTWWIGEYTDMIVILLVVAVNAMIGFFQDYRASKIFEKLKAAVRVTALVRRGGKIQSIPAEELVPGDIVIIKGGNKIPADSRIIEEANLETNEALLTGESKPVKKEIQAVNEKALIGDRKNMVFMGTAAEAGEGLGVVVATARGTEIGKIAALTLETREEETPLQARMRSLGKFISEIFVATAIAIFLIGLFGGRNPIEMVKTTIAVAVAAIPEGLPAAISVILAVSSKRIFEKKGLVMKLVAAETLGSTSVICTDKTGTLTYGQMKVEQIITPSWLSPLEKGEKERGCLLAMALANEAVLEEKDGKYIVRGEATDKAKLEALLASGQNFKNISEKYPRLAILSFDPTRKYIASFHKQAQGLKIFLSGAPETIIGLSNLPSEKITEAKKTYEQMAARGYRMIAQAEKYISGQEITTKREDLIAQINNLEFLGLAAIRDPVREDVRSTLKTTREAGIKVIMVTGDHLLTAKAIGRELGFSDADGAMVLGEELEKLTDKQLRERIGKLEVVARVTPEHKMRIIDAWQKLGAVVAMTGDGVNDAPALKSANIGVAIGSGTDVAKEASDLVLLDDSFSTITSAVQEGRTGFANIRKATLVVMSNAFTELTLIASSLLFSTPFPITAVQILWVNLALDSLPVLSLAFEPQEKDIMKRKPISPKEPILDRETKSIIFAVSIFTDLILVGIFLYLIKFSGWDIIKIQSFIFTATAFPTLINIFAFKSLRLPLRKIELMNNRFLIVSVLIGFMLMFAALYVPAFNRFLKTTPLPASALMAVVAFAIFKLILVELTKWWYNRN